MQMQNKTDETYIRDSENIQLSYAQAARFKWGLKDTKEVL